MKECVKSMRLVRRARLGRNVVMLLAMSIAAVVPLIF